MNLRIAGLFLALIGLVAISSGIYAQGGAPAAPAGTPDPAFFATKLYPVLQEARCRGCHAQRRRRLGHAAPLPGKGRHPGPDRRLSACR